MLDEEDAGLDAEAKTGQVDGLAGDDGIDRDCSTSAHCGFAPRQPSVVPEIHAVTQAGHHNTRRQGRLGI